MNKETYLQDLRKALKILPQYDRDEAVEFYEEYFDEAGVENEAKVIEELGEPKVLAKKILVDVVDRRYEEYTGTGSAVKTAYTAGETAAAEAAAMPADAVYADGTQSVGVIATVPQAAEGAQGAQGAQYAAQGAQPVQERPKSSSLKTLWIVLAAIFALPLSPVVFALLIVVCTLIFVGFVTMGSFILAGGACIITGILSAVLGIIALFGHPAAGLIAMGSGLAAFGIGMFMIIGSVALIRLMANGLSRLFGRIVHKKNKKQQAAR